MLSVALMLSVVNAECHMLALMLSIVMPSIVMMNVVMLSVVAPYSQHFIFFVTYERAQ
jgi:hypothetical protein